MAVITGNVTNNKNRVDTVFNTANHVSLDTFNDLITVIGTTQVALTSNPNIVVMNVAFTSKQKDSHSFTSKYKDPYRMEVVINLASYTNKAVTIVMNKNVNKVRIITVISRT